ncbi:hypothetical protein N0V88_001838 [Collariella sp. IMI 366227]|nr:hypothetical protein N0V88_001838 [Collariella sp. IMI 366227]
MVKPNKGKQQTLEATLGQPPQPCSSSPASAFMRSSQVARSARKPDLRKRRAVVFEESEFESEDELALPVRESSGKKRQGVKRKVGSSSGGEELEEEEEEEESDDMPLVTPTPKRKRRVVASDSEDSDDQPLVSSPVKRRRLVQGGAVSSPVKGVSREVNEPAPFSARARRKPMSKKEKARELLRRKRAGEVIDEDEEEGGSSEDEPQRAIYDTDSDNPALCEFKDDEEGVLGDDLGTNKGKKTKGKEKAKAKKKETRKASDDDRSGSDDSIDDFLVDDSDAPLGIPEEVYMNMPLEFTAHSHKPLKEHFRDAIEWLVQFKINPGFAEKEHALYRMAWKKLDDEVRGLAQSKFASSAWKVDFTMALRARPYYTSVELPKGDLLEMQSCGACGRSGHPARHIITFTGTPYYKDTTKLARLLQPVEFDTSDSSSSSHHHHQDQDQDEDEDGNLIPKPSRQWHVGKVCNSNAETAHDLMHWKHALLDWVDTQLHKEGYMAPSKLVERERMRPKKKYKVVDEILQRWVDTGVVKALYGDFKGTVEKARE